jgi:hypothetical protein
VNAAGIEKMKVITMSTPAMRAVRLIELMTSSFPW